MEIFDIRISIAVVVGLSVFVSILGLTYKIYSGHRNQNEPIFTIDDFIVLDTALDDKINEDLDRCYKDIDKQDTIINLNGLLQDLP